MPKIEVKSKWSCAEVYLHGAQVTDFQLRGQAPVLFMSQFSRFDHNQPIRGGIPVIFPWFGPREGEPMHGFARLADWHLHETTALPEGGATLRFSLPDVGAAAMWPPFSANLVVTVTDSLTLELILTNTARDQVFTFENCLHSYFHVGDISRVGIHGLSGATYLDKADGYGRKTETAAAIRVAAEVDRIFLDTPAAVEIHDEMLGRKIIIEKAGSSSTVIWNPWLAKAQQMPDLGNEEYKQMLCVESGNVAANRISLPPGHSSVLKVTIRSIPL